MALLTSYTLHRNIASIMKGVVTINQQYLGWVEKCPNSIMFENVEQSKKLSLYCH